MEPDANMDEYDDGGLPSVDDLTVVAEIAAAELRQLEKIQAAVGASELRRRLESQQRNPGAAKGYNSNDGQEDGVPGVRKEGDANGGNDMEGSSDSGDEAGEHGDSAPESDSGDTIQNLETVLKQMEATPVEPDSQPAGPLHGLELAELSAEQQDIQIKDTDELTHIGRVASVVDGIIVVKVTQPTYAVRPCGAQAESLPEVGAKIMAASSLIVRVDLGTAANTPAIDFEDDEEEVEDLDNDDIEGDGSKKVTAGSAANCTGEGKSSKGSRKGGKSEKPPAVFQGVAGVDNAEDALKAAAPKAEQSGGRDGGGRGRGRGRGRGGGREGGGRGAAGRRRGGAGGRHSGGRRPDGPGAMEGAAHSPQMQWVAPAMGGGAVPMMFTPAGPAGTAMGAMRPQALAQPMHAGAGMQPGMPLMVAPQGFMHPGGAMVAAPMAGGLGAPQMHMRPPPAAGARPVFAPRPPPQPPRGPMLSPSAGGESFEQKLARALGPPPS